MSNFKNIQFSTIARIYHYGIYAVEMIDPQRTRKPKASVTYYKKVIETSQVDREYEPTLSASRLEL